MRSNRFIPASLAQSQKLSPLLLTVYKYSILSDLDVLPTMQQTLPEKYYLVHARELFDYIDVYCAHLLRQQHRDYLLKLNGLSEDALCLMIRLLARKPRFFARDKLQYAEIEDTPAAIKELLVAGLLAVPSSDDWSELLRILTKAELVELLDPHIANLRRSTNKGQLIELARHRFRGDETALDQLKQRWLVRSQQACVDYLFFLFFGDLRNRFQSFAMRDLGVLRTRKPRGEITARFASREEAEEVFRYSKLLRDYRHDPQAQLRPLAAHLAEHSPDHALAIKVYDKLILQVASDLQPTAPDQAVALWRRSAHPEAFKRWIRCEYASGDQETLKAELEALRETPICAQKQVFLEDFYQRKYCGKRTSVFTDMLRESELRISLDECFTGDVERGVCQFFKQNGQQAWFTENKVWHVLFAFTLWPILYGRDKPQHGEFDYLPAALRRTNFYAHHKLEIEARLALLSDPERCLAEFTHLAARCYGMPTGLFRWSAKLLDTLRPLVQFAPPGALAAIVKNMALDYSNRNAGYPDLMVVQEGGLLFVEVKAPGDSLRPNQLLSIERLRSAGIKVDIAQVEWATNPEQVYAVVDIETTGTRKSGSAITEIAVVRMQNREIVDEWSTLVNPGRPIPAHITRLTGINNQMVASAPIFSEVADPLAARLEQAIFVAHNVGFDYGFIKAAYSDLGRGFRKPKLCTVRAARRAFPGLRSYSLGNLASEFDLGLDHAHRALHDARATAHLLGLIQAAS